MSHPIYEIHNIEQQIIKIDELLHSLNDNKAPIMAIIKKIKKDIKEQKTHFNKYDNEKKWEQIGYFDNVKFEFSIRDLCNDVVALYEREYKDCTINMKMINDIIRAERAIQNQNENLLNAKITILNIEENMEDGEV